MGRGERLFEGGSDLTARYGHAEAGEDLLGLKLVDLHKVISVVGGLGSSRPDKRPGSQK
jgi:hypothetical protein